MTTRNLALSPKQLQKKYKHAVDMGWDLPPNYNPQNGEAFGESIQAFVNGPSIVVVVREDWPHASPMTLVNYVDPETGMGVKAHPDGTFLSCWCFKPHQLAAVLNNPKVWALED